ncbi:MAG: hypothetical protein RMJ98_02350 [Myxococcales bacterium]|nr:hypothetical protein [Polyangiaceae bacterium]MDW8248130.1 hypothetical protein [Myxococcales bacterium]
MHRLLAHSWARGFPTILGLILLAAPAALLAEACGGATEDELENPGQAGQAGQASEGAGGKAGSAGTAGQGDGGSAGGGAAGAAGVAGAAGAAGAVAGAAGGGVAGSAGTAGTAGSGGAPNPCAQCIQEKCKDPLETCQADPGCAEISACVLEHCLDSPSQGELAQCAFSQCGASINDQGLIPVAQCAGQQCDASVCPFTAGAGGSGGAPSDPGVEPGVITCGPNLGCDVEKDGTCCITIADFSGPKYSCTKGPCAGSFVNINQPCDGPEDCNDGQVCCAAASQQNGAGVQCTSECKPPANGQAFTLCHKDEDCTNGNTCQVCDIGQFGISLVFRICGTQCPGFGGP